MELVFTLIAFGLILFSLFSLGDKDDFPSGPVFILGLVCLIPLGLYSIQLSQIDHWTVKNIEIVSSEDIIYKIKLIKDPGALFFNEEHFVYTTKNVNINDKIKDTQVNEDSLIKLNENSPSP